jgi:NADPH:quinone reductase-like Zn-dependent oxidoreductase
MKLPVWSRLLGMALKVSNWTNAWQRTRCTAALLNFLLSKLAMFGNLFVGARLRGRRGIFYGITALYRKDPRPLREDLPKIFALLKEKQIDPLVQCTFAILQAREAIELLAAGSVEGKIVLIG